VPSSPLSNVVAAGMVVAGASNLLGVADALAGGVKYSIQASVLVVEIHPRMKLTP
jgi:hypothetical protein